MLVDEPCQRSVSIMLMLRACMRTACVGCSQTAFQQALCEHSSMDLSVLAILKEMLGVMRCRRSHSLQAVDPHSDVAV